MSDTEGEAGRRGATVEVSGGSGSGSGPTGTAGRDTPAIAMEEIAAIIARAVREGMSGTAVPTSDVPPTSIMTTTVTAGGGLPSGPGVGASPLLPIISSTVSSTGSIDLSTPISVTAPVGDSSTTTPGASSLVTWSLPEWLKMPEMTATPQKQPLAISSALPPIPARAVEKIEKGVFIDFKELLHDNVTLFNTLQELGSSAPTSVQRMRDITDPLSWAYCFLSFVAVSIRDKETRDLLAYGQVIIQMARSHGGLGWVSYDRRFRQQKAAGMPLQWSEVNSSLMAATVLGGASSTPIRTCSRCFSWDHEREDCALASLDAQTRFTARPKPYRVPEPCRRFNAGNCSYSSERCRYTHNCSTCGRGGHSAVDCFKGKGKARAAPPTTSAQPFNH